MNSIFFGIPPLRFSFDRVMHIEGESRVGTHTVTYYFTLKEANDKNESSAVDLCECDSVVRPVVAPVGSDCQQP